MIKIIKVSQISEVFKKYDSQQYPQDSYIQLDCKYETLTASYNSEIANDVPLSVYYGIAIRFDIPHLMPETINNLMEKILPLTQIVLNGYKLEYDGSNHIAFYTDEALETIEDIRSICEEIEYDENQFIYYYSADDYYENSIKYLDINNNICSYNKAVKIIINGREITHLTTSTDLEDIESILTDQQNSNEIVDGLKEFLEDIKINCINHLEEPKIGE